MQRLSAMTLVVGVLGMLFGMAFGTTVAAETETVAAPAASAVSEDAAKRAYSQKKVCTKRKVTGSNIKKTTCRTQAEADAQHEQAEKLVEEENRKLGVNPGGSMMGRPTRH
jgi:basic membrane lipoprotein Med (substrate-binding protein (PBP1-ABC) superfamily)